jgi:hypothetical protein
MTYLEDLQTLVKAAREKKNPSASPRFKGDKCNAHQYHLIPQGLNPKSRYIYRCERGGCRHYATIADITGRVAECYKCKRAFAVALENYLKDSAASSVVEIFHTHPICNDCLNPSVTVTIPTVETLDFLEE